MKLALVSLVGVNLCTLFQVPGNSAADVGPADLIWARGHGRVEVQQIDERKLRLEIDGPTGATQRELGHRVIQAKASGFMESGLVLALTIEEGDQRSYRFALTRQLAPGLEAEIVGNTSDGMTSWWLSQPIFSDPDAPYRIVDVHKPGSDYLEITFRRGYARLQRSSAGQLDELVFVDPCPYAASADHQAGRTQLIRVVDSGS